MSSLIIILRPSPVTLNSWRIQIDGLHDDQMKKLSKKIEHVKYKRECMTEKLISVQWRIDISNKESVLMPIKHIAPLVYLFQSWGYKLLSCEKGVHFDTDIIFWTLIREDEKKKSRKL